MRNLGNEKRHGDASDERGWCGGRGGKAVLGTGPWGGGGGVGFRELGVGDPMIVRHKILCTRLPWS